MIDLNDQSIMAAALFNAYQDWYSKLKATDKKIDCYITFRIRAFGSEEEKQKTWKDEWQPTHPTWDKASAGVTISTSVPQVWVDLKEDNCGNLILPPHVLGHELMHVIKLKDNSAVNPDNLIKDIYK